MDWDLWLKAEIQIREYDTPGPTGHYSQIAPADPLRFACVLSSDNAVNSFWGFGESGSTHTPINLTTTTGVLVFTYDMIGQAITLPIQGQNSSTSQNLTVTTYSYLPHRKRIFDDFVRQFLSQLGAL